MGPTDFSGSYYGWVRGPDDEDWEDMVGAITLECRDDVEGGPLVGILTSLEFGVWTGSLDKENGAFEGVTADARFRLVAQRTLHEPVRFLGGVYRGQAADPSLRLLLRKSSE